MPTRYYIAMAHYVAENVQSDELFLMKLRDGRLIGYSAEFDYATCDIAAACHCDDVLTCSPKKHDSARWFGLSAEDARDWTPASLDEIKSLKLEKYLIGSKSNMKCNTPIDPVYAH